MIEEKGFIAGKAAVKSGDIDTARKMLNPIIQSQAHHPSAFFLAQAEYKHGNNETAKQHCAAYIEKHQQHLGARILAGRIALKQGDINDAASHLNKARTLSAEDSAVQQLTDEIEAQKRNQGTQKLIDIVDGYSQSNADGKIPEEVLAAAEALGKIEPLNSWNRDITQAKVANFHFASSVESALDNYIPSLLEISVEFDYLTWPKRIQQYIKGKSVIDVGCGFGGYGTGFLAAGATSYLGLDPVMNLDSTKAKNKRIREWADMGITPNAIQEECPDIRLFQGTSEELRFDEKFDVISLHNVTEHLIQLDLVFEGMVQLCHKDTKIVFMHHNYYCWNGHHKSPNQPGQIVNGVGKGEQMLLMDWRHIPFADSAPDDHYVKTHLNRVTLDEIKDITSKYFEIEEWNEIPSNKPTLERLSDDIVDNIRLTHPHLTKRDLETNVVFAICGAK